MLRALYATPAWPPGLSERDVPTPRVEASAEGAEVDGDVRAWAVYRENDAAWVIDRIVSDRQHIALGSGRWAISALHRDGNESQAVVIER